MTEPYIPTPRPFVPWRTVYVATSAELAAAVAEASRSTENTQIYATSAALTLPDLPPTVGGAIIIDGRGLG